MHTKKSSSSIKSERKDEGEDWIDLTNKCRRSIKVEISDLLKQLVKRKSENYEKHKQSILWNKESNSAFISVNDVQQADDFDIVL